MTANDPIVQQLHDEIHALRQQLAALEATVAAHNRPTKPLQQYEAFIQTLADATTDLIFAKDLQGRYVMVNAAFAQTLNMSVEDIIGKDDAALFPSLMAQQLRQADKSILTSGETRTLEEIGISTGPIRYYQSTKGVYRNDQGQVMGLFGISRDVTAHKHAEAALRTSEEKFRDLIQGSIEGIVIHTHWTIVFANQSYADILGYQDAAALLGVDLLEHLATPDDRERLLQYQSTRERGEEVPSRYETRAVHKNGSMIWLDVLARPILWEGKRAIQVTVTDITERKRFEEALRQSEAMLQAIFDSSPFSLILIDRHYIIRAFNKCAAEQVDLILHKSLQPGLSVCDFVHSPEAFKDRFHAALQGQTIHIEVEYPQLSGPGYWIEMHYNPVFADDGQITGVCLGITNISARVQAAKERQRLEEQLRQAQKMEAIGVLAGGIAHDFNNVLAIIIGYTELATFDLPQHSAAWLSLQEVLEASERAKDLVQQILTFSRQSDRGHQPVHIPTLLQETLTLLRASLPTTITIRQQIDPAAGTIFADPTQMHQILINLGSNAEHAMRETGGILAIDLEAVDIDDTSVHTQPPLSPGPYVRLTVRDTGHGMTPEVVERIFEPFFTTKEVGSGTGMGLAVVHGIVASHHGTIHVTSTPGEGTTFTLYFPRHDDSEHRDAPSERLLRYGHGRILFVEDEAALADLGKTMLEHLGYEAVSCTSSVQALDIFRATPQHFDLVITDQTMPQMTGEHLSQALRQIRPDIPIILCTGFSHVIDAEKARSMGINAFCIKPLVARDLSRIIQQVLDERPRD